MLSLLSLDLKGMLASQLFTGSDYYLQVLNTDNASFKAALQLLKQPDGVKGLLAPVKEQPPKTKVKGKKK